MELITKFSERYSEKFLDYLPSFLLSILILFIGIWAIRIAKKLLIKVFEKKRIEVTLKNFLLEIILWTLKAVLFVVVISQLGVGAGLSGSMHSDDGIASL